jgi:predicted Zn-ribbon and HTH transcriptional regulator
VKAIVVGGGLAGIAAALELAALQPTLAIALQSSDPDTLRRRARATRFPLFDKVDFDRLLAWVAAEVASLRRRATALRVVGDLSCARCGYGIATESPPRRCPMCDSATEWTERGTRARAIGC